MIKTLEVLYVHEVEDSLDSLINRLTEIKLKYPDVYQIFIEPYYEFSRECRCDKLLYFMIKGEL